MCAPAAHVSARHGFFPNSHLFCVWVSRRLNLFWIPPDQGYKLGPPGGLADPIRNVRNVKKTPRWVILEEKAVLMGLLLGY